MINQNRNTPGPSAFISRRQFLKDAGLLAGAAFAGSLLLAESCKRTVTQTALTTTTTAPPSSAPATAVRFPPVNGLEYLVNADPATIDNSTLPVTPLNLLHVISPSPQVDIDSYRLNVHGLVSNPLNLAYADLQNFPMLQKTVLLICPTAFADNGTLGGFALTDLLDSAGVPPGAAQLVFSTLSNQNQTVSMTEALSGGLFMALTEDGQALSQGHGYPLRLVRPGQIGVYWLKCINDIEVI
jgi:sulfoxide reductase catalytic subunit YedY